MPDKSASGMPVSSRQVFAPLSMADNLRLGAVTRKDNAIGADRCHLCDVPGPGGEEPPLSRHALAIADRS